VSLPPQNSERYEFGRDSPSGSVARDQSTVLEIIEAAQAAGAAAGPT